jgi:hypothetical protein
MISAQRSLLRFPTKTLGTSESSTMTFLVPTAPAWECVFILKGVMLEHHGMHDLCAAKLTSFPNEDVGNE